MIRQLIYQSRATLKMSPEVLRSILRKAQTKNSRQQLSGFLIFHHGEFLQLLEGPQAHVEDIFAQIRLDPRHYDVRIRLEIDSAARAMPAWVMGFGSSETRYQTLQDENFHLSMPETQGLCELLPEPLKTVFFDFIGEAHPQRD